MQPVKGSRLAISVRWAEALPFGDASFDVVYCCDVLEHVNEVRQVIAETARVLRPGGIYLSDTINRDPPEPIDRDQAASGVAVDRLDAATMHDWNDVYPASRATSGC